MEKKRFPKPNVKLQISLTLVSMITLGTSNSFKGKGIFSQSVEGAAGKWGQSIPNVLITIMADTLQK